MFRHSTLLIALASAGCMLSPTNHQEVAGKTSQIRWSGYHLRPGRTLRVEAEYAPNGQFYGIGSSGRFTSRTSPTAGLPFDDKLYAWSGYASLPSWAWTDGNHSGAKARVRAVTHDSDEYQLYSFEADWQTCDDYSGRSAEAYAKACSSDDSPYVTLYAGKYCDSEPVLKDLSYPVEFIVSDASCEDGDILLHRPAMRVHLDRPTYQDVRMTIFDGENGVYSANCISEYPNRGTYICSGSVLRQQPVPMTDDEVASLPDGGQSWSFGADYEVWVTARSAEPGCPTSRMRTYFGDEVWVETSGGVGLHECRTPVVEPPPEPEPSPDPEPVPEPLPDLSMAPITSLDGGGTAYFTVKNEGRGWVRDDFYVYYNGSSSNNEEGWRIRITDDIPPGGDFSWRAVVDGRYHDEHYAEHQHGSAVVTACVDFLGEVLEVDELGGQNMMCEDHPVCNPGSPATNCF